jgi:Spy/CpxP family protein refolding chaperone
MVKDSKVRTLMSLVVVGLIVGAVAIGVASAQQAGGKYGKTAIGGRAVMPFGPLGAVRRGLAQLGLSDDQKQQIKSVFQDRRTELKDLRQQMRQARRAVAEAIASDEGEAAIRAKSAELAKVQADLAVLGAKIRKQVFAILTPEQQAKAKELRQKALKRLDRLAGGRP